jgi:hypothetical protein
MKTSTRKAAEELYQASGGHGEFPAGSVYAVADAAAGREFQRFVSAGLFTKIDAAPDGARVRGLDVQVMDRESARESAPPTPAPAALLSQEDIVVRHFGGNAAAFDVAVGTAGFPEPRMRMVNGHSFKAAWKEQDVRR